MTQSVIATNSNLLNGVKQNYKGHRDCKLGHWEPAYSPESYEGMMLNVVCVKVFGTYLAYCVDLQCEEVEGDTQQDSLDEFLREVNARVVGQNGGLFIQPSPFEHQEKCLRKYLSPFTDDVPVVEWETMSRHTLHYHASLSLFA